MANCSTFLGRLLECKTYVGGIRGIFVAPKETYGSATIDLQTLVWSLAMNNESTPATLPVWYYELKGNNSFDTTGTSSRANGTTFYESTVTATLTGANAEIMAELQEFGKGEFVMFVWDRNGHLWLLGEESGLGSEMTTSASSWGVELGDAVGTTLTIVTQSTHPPLYNSTAYTSVAEIQAGTDIAPQNPAPTP